MLTTRACIDGTDQPRISARSSIYHKMSPKHLQRYMNEFTSRHNVCEMDTIDQTRHVVTGMVGKRPMHRSSWSRMPRKTAQKTGNLFYKGANVEDVALALLRRTPKEAKPEGGKEKDSLDG